MDADQPRTCAGCGGKLRMTKDELWLDTGRRLSYHWHCRPRPRQLSLEDEQATAAAIEEGLGGWRGVFAPEDDAA